MAIVLGYAAIYLIWGSTFLAIRIAVDSIPPLLMMGVRCVAAGSMLVAWAALRGERANARQWGHALLAGGLMFGGAYGGLAWAEQRIPSGVAALIVATLPLRMTSIEWLQRGARPSLSALLGVATGFGGVALLVVRGGGAPLALLPIAIVVLGEGAGAVEAGGAQRRDAAPRRRRDADRGVLDRTRAADISPARRVDRIARRAQLSHRVRINRRLLGLRVAAPGLAGVARRHARLRQPADRGGPRRRGRR